MISYLWLKKGEKMERVIQVTGKGKLSVPPDQIRILLDVRDGCSTYEETLCLSVSEVDTLKVCFYHVGFKKSDLKTISFHIDTKYENYRDQQNEYKRKFVGYEFCHSLKIEFPADNLLLGKVLYELSKCSVRPEFRIEYTIKDTDAAKNELLQNAVIDSKTKAEILTKAAGVKLGEVMKIDYSWGEIDFTSRPFTEDINVLCCAERSADSTLPIDIEPDDIQVSDTVTVIWGIS